METIVVAHVHNRNQNHYCGSKRDRGLTKLQTGNCKGGISCRSFQSGAGLLPTPLKYLSSPVSKNACCSPLSPQIPSPAVNESQKSSKRTAKSSSIPIPVKINFENKVEDFHFSELWAGPAYSCSPPPSSLPLPNFFLWPKRTVSLDLPSLASEIDMRPIAKSAPASPTRGCRPSPNDLFDTADSATKTLRRILNLDIIDG